MKRDMELIRKILLFVEDHPHGFAPSLDFEGYTQEQIGYHAYLIVESGLAVGRELGSVESKSPVYGLVRLTPAGHDFAESARSPHVWDEVMADARERGVIPASLDLLKKLLDKSIRKRLDVE